MAELDAATTTLAERLAAGPTVAYGAMKRLMRQSLERSLPEQLAAEQQAFAHCAATGDFREGIEAFYARRPAQFNGR